MKRIILLIGLLFVVGGVFAAPATPPLFKRGDADGDGVLTKAEFLAIREVGAREYFAKKNISFEEKVPDPAKRYGREFKKWDKDADGLISVDEWKAKGK